MEANDSGIKTITGTINGSTIRNEKLRDKIVPKESSSAEKGTRCAAWWEICTLDSSGGEPLVRFSEDNWADPEGRLNRPIAQEID